MSTREKSSKSAKKEGKSSKKSKSSTAGDPPTDELSKLKVTAGASSGKSSSKSKSSKTAAAATDKPAADEHAAGAKTDDKLDKDTIIEANGVAYRPLHLVGTGSFGVVIQAQLVESGELVAIKKVLQDKRFKNRELQIMRLLNHPNVVQLKSSFYTSGSKSTDDVYLNLVLEFVPETVYRVARQYSKKKEAMPMIYIKCYIYQLLKALEYIHDLGICHRDIKPQNLLLDTPNSVLKLCDFGSAKILVKGEPNVAYICSRYYRAPELIFGATAYTTAIDIWSTGCVLAELILGAPMFPGASGMDQLVEIIKVLGTPTKEQIKLMNPKYTEFRFPQIKSHPWSRVFRSKTEPEAIEMVAALLVYDPTTRLTASQALEHTFFEELKTDVVLPNGRQLPLLLGINDKN